MRTFRARYQLSVATGGGRRTFSVNRRAESSARILYYHRVSDEGDPFFQAIATDLFDQEMRYIARHYKVVSLSDIPQHLESGSAEMVLAVTFDDGYQDNFHNAL